MHSEQMTASSEVKGVAQIWQEGPVNFSIPDQHEKQKGAVLRLSVSFMQEGQMEG